jgi:hypothetical protein
MSQASGTPASTSKAATVKPTMKEFRIEVNAVFIRAGWFMTFWMVGAFIRMPRIGGIRIIAKKMMTAER